MKKNYLTIFFDMKYIFFDFCKKNVWKDGITIKMSVLMRGNNFSLWNSSLRPVLFEIIDIVG